MKERREKATNMSKTSEVPDSSMSVCVRPSICTSPFDPEAGENQQMINATFVGQAQRDLR
jgi:hypothetical protein